MPKTTCTLLLTLIFTFILPISCLTAQEPDSLPEVGDSNVHFRGSLDNCRTRFTNKKQGRVAFIGGSITQMNGYRPMTCQLLQETFPETEFTFIDAGISSTCSTTGAFRVESHVLDHGPIDLFFIEFAVNDDQDARHPIEQCTRGMEGIIRHTRMRYPNADIVVTYFVNDPMRELRAAGETPLSMQGHEPVVQHYDVSTIDLATEVAQQIEEGTLTWQKFGGVHPAPYGNAICTNMIANLFKTAWQEPLSANATMTPHDMPKRLDEFSYDGGRFLSPGKAEHDDAWEWATPPWSELRGACREQFQEEKLLSASTPGAQLELAFEGTAIGAYVLAGPDAGILEYQIDDLPPGQVDLYHHHSRGLHYPRTVMFAEELSPGPHTLRLTVASETSSQSKGTAARILQFTENVREAENNHG
jgi:hypothetical protein